MLGARVLLVVPQMCSYQSRVMQGAARYCQEHGLNAVLVDMSVQDNPATLLRRIQADGLVAGVGSDALREALLTDGRPVVNVSATFDSLPFQSVLPDDSAIVNTAVDYFRSRGYRNFACCHNPGLRRHSRRCDTLVAILRRLGMQCAVHAAPIISSNPSTEPGIRDGIARWLADLARPLALLAGDDLWGHCAIEAARQAKLRVPEDVAVLGMGNDPLACGMTQPGLSSIDISAEQVGYLAASRLAEMLRNGGERGTSVIVRPAGVVSRGSTDAAGELDEDVAAAVHLIHKHVASPFGVEDILDQVPLSRRTLERRFATIVGRSPSAEIRRIKMAHAAQLLSTTPMTLTQVARATGFRSLRAFRQAFERERGVDPAGHRQRSRNGSASQEPRSAAVACATA